MCRRATVGVILTACAAIGLSERATCQPQWTDQTNERVVSVEFLKPEFDGKDDTDFLTAAIFLSGRLPLSPTVEGEAELPLSRYGISNDRVDRSESAVGNPYVGVRIRSAKLLYQLGMRLPFASNDDATPLTSGRLADNDRFDAFLPDELSVNAAVSGLTRLSDKVDLNLGAGPLLLVSTEDNAGDDAELYARYLVIGQYDGGQFVIKSGFTGHIWLTEDDLDFGRRSVTQFGLAGALKTGTVRPGLLVRIPLDEVLSDNIDYVLGINVDVVLH